MIRILLAAILLSAVSGFAATTELLHTFKKVRATDQFWAEGAAKGEAADFNCSRSLAVEAEVCAVPWMGEDVCAAGCAKDCGGMGFGMRLSTTPNHRA